MQRIDVYLVEQGYFPSRTAAQAAIMAGLVSISGQKVGKPSTIVPQEAKVEVKEKPRYVSRGALKLKKALDEFNIQVTDKVALDAGTSTGGFAQILLERGTRKVIAVDVGYGQFDYKLRQDKRVELYERTNIRYFKPELEERPDLAVVDLSFISITKVIDNILSLLKKDAELVILVKPQFETEAKLAKKGVVKDPAVHKSVLEKVLDELTGRKLKVAGLTFSPIKGPKGNIEFLAYLKRQGRGIENLPELIDHVVSQAHKQ